MMPERAIGRWQGLNDALFGVWRLKRDVRQFEMVFCDPIIPGDRRHFRRRESGDGEQKLRQILGGGVVTTG